MLGEITDKTNQRTGMPVSVSRFRSSDDQRQFILSIHYATLLGPSLGEPVLFPNLNKPDKTLQSFDWRSQQEPLEIRPSHTTPVV